MKNEYNIMIISQMVFIYQIILRKNKNNMIYNGKMWNIGSHIISLYDLSWIYNKVYSEN